MPPMPTPPPRGNKALLIGISNHYGPWSLNYRPHKGGDIGEVPFDSHDAPFRTR